jgi:hypothetical protein
VALANIPERIKQDRGKLAGAPAMHHTIHNLPFPPNPVFTGRDADMDILSELLGKRGESTVTQTVALHGLGGVGKTQLAVEYAWKHLRDYDAVFWVKADNDSPKPLDTSLAAIAQVLRLSEANEREEAVQMNAVLDWLNNHGRWLLIVDNADTDAAARAVCDRFPPNLPGQVLITSRISDWPVSIQDLALALLSTDDATRYLVERLAKRRHNAGGEASAKSLAQDLDNLPLALEQAASFIVEMRWSFAKYQEQFREARPKFLSEHREGGTRYPASVAMTWGINRCQKRGASSGSCGARCFSMRLRQSNRTLSAPGAFGYPLGRTQRHCWSIRNGMVSTRCPSHWWRIGSECF